MCFLYLSERGGGAVRKVELIVGLVRGVMAGDLWRRGLGLDF